MNKKIIMTGLLTLSLGGLLMSTMFQSVEARFGENRQSNQNNATYAQVEELSIGELESLEKTLTVLINDEFKARAEYVAIVDKFGEVSPFINLIRAESMHIKALTRLFNVYDLDLPEDNGSQYAVVPNTLVEAYEIGKQAEISNIALYEDYLAEDLPVNVERVFTNLMSASENHLDTFIAYQEGKTIEDCVPLLNTKSRQNRRNN